MARTNPRRINNVHQSTLKRTREGGEIHPGIHRVRDLRMPLPAFRLGPFSLFNRLDSPLSSPFRRHGPGNTTYNYPIPGTPERLG